MTLYTWLKFFHLLGLVLFLFGHGMTAGASFALRSAVSAQTRQLLLLSQRTAALFYPGLLVIVVTGVWMAFLGSWWRSGWVWAAIVVLVIAIGAMAGLARPYYKAREAKTDQDVGQELSRARPGLLAWIGAVALLLLVGLMVLKPF
jgi:uncharacterized membrane protein